MRTEYREMRYSCGERYMEVDIYPMYRSQRGRGRRGKPTTDVQAKLNQRNAERRLERLLLTNFTDGDYEVHLTYDDAHLPASEEEDAAKVRAFLRRVRRWIDKNLDGHSGAELKYINITEGGINGKRWHHHMTMSGLIPRDTLEHLWGQGFANTKSLVFDSKGLEGLVRYITKQSRGEERELGKKRWSCSQNLKKPEESSRDGKVSAKRIREAIANDELRGMMERYYPGYNCTDARCILNDVNGGYYLKVKLYRTQKRTRK